MSERWIYYEPGSYAITAHFNGAEILDEIIAHHEQSYIGEEMLNLYLDLYEYEAERQNSSNGRRAFQKRMEHYFDIKGYNFYLSQ
ncbi:hypothetical protein M3223_22795 [Paenibacillus pasadenensis]|uniref:hypothetical protein n=1 Tax=Paenibacillus pasadenensis TaxID=217090 RepID=UPI0020408261|nr:hypothetical protein [Paenibacillus pasadenensis]MCM3750169.1 hypothetical protein [Paenibacillus pasadenensis]